MISYKKINIYLIKFFIFIYIFSFLFVQLINFDFIYNINISISEIIYFFLLILFLINISTNFTDYIKRLSIFDLFLIAFVIINILFFLYFENFTLKIFINLIYVISIYFLFSYFLNFFNIKILIKNSLISITISSSVIILLSYIAYLFGIQISIFDNPAWEISELYNPVYGSYTTHFKGFFKFYNMQAYVMTPGLFLMLSDFKYKRNLYKILLVLIIFAIYLIKTKIIVLILPCFLFYILVFHYKLFPINYIFCVILIFLLFILYCIFTNFIFTFTKLDVINNSSYQFYFTKNYIYKINDIYIYGTLFYKLKLIALEFFNENPIFYHQLKIENFKNIISLNNISNADTKYPFTPHFELINLYIKYGINGLIFYLFLIIFYFTNLSKNFKILSLKNDFFIYAIILAIFFIESLNTDIHNFRFLWILLPVFYLNYNRRDKLI